MQRANTFQDKNNGTSQQVIHQGRHKSQLEKNLLPSQLIMQRRESCIKRSNTEEVILLEKNKKTVHGKFYAKMIEPELPDWRGAAKFKRFYGLSLLDDQRVLTVVGHGPQHPRKVLRYVVQKSKDINFMKILQQLQELLPPQGGYIEKVISYSGKVIVNVNDFFDGDDVVFAVYNNFKLRKTDRSLNKEEQQEVNRLRRPVHGLGFIEECTNMPNANINLQPADPNALTELARAGLEYDKLPAIVKSAFIMDSVLGDGNFTYIVKIIQRTNKSEYALKIFDIERIEAKVYANEAKLLDMARHPYVVNLFGSANSSRYHCLFLEYLPGDILMFMERLGPLNELEASYVIKCLSTALSYLHALNIVHCDVKPENLLIRLESKTNCIKSVKLTDFNVSFEYGKIMSHVCGTKLFIAPEVVDGGICTPKTDIWAAGITLHIMLSAILPYKRACENTKEFYEMVHESVLEFTKESLPGKSESCINLLNKMLAKNPADRLTSSAVLKNVWTQQTTALQFAYLKDKIAKSRNMRT